jgi:hypothetical protein
LFGFVVGDGVVEGGLGDFAEEFGELLDDFVGGGDDFEAIGAEAFGIADEEAAGFLAEPLDEVEFTGEFGEFVDAIEGVAAAAAFSFFGGLGPFVDEGEGEAELCGDLFGARFVDGLFDNFVRFHGLECGWGCLGGDCRGNGIERAKEM